MLKSFLKGHTDTLHSQSSVAVSLGEGKEDYLLLIAICYQLSTSTDNWREGGRERGGGRGRVVEETIIKSV